jgi:hypothetical protein
MSYTHADVVGRHESPDGQSELEMLARFDGLFEFRESKLTEFDHPTGPEKVWIPGYSSGLFQTRGEAEDEARKVIDWLRDT